MAHPAHEQLSYDPAAPAILAAKVGEAVKSSGGVHMPPERYYHFPGVFGETPALAEQWFARLPLPIGQERPDHQQVVFPAEDGFERHYSEEAIITAYANNPRVPMYEDTARLDRGWQWRASQLLMKLFGYEVAFSFFDSAPGDKGFGPHTDSSQNTVLQMFGEKAWWLGEDADKPDVEPTLVLQAGSILVLPSGYPHNVKPLDVRSVHLAIDTLLDRPLRPKAAPTTSAEAAN